MVFFRIPMRKTLMMRNPWERKRGDRVNQKNPRHRKNQKLQKNQRRNRRGKFTFFDGTTLFIICEIELSTVFYQSKQFREKKEKEPKEPKKRGRKPLNASTEEGVDNIEQSDKKPKR